MGTEELFNKYYKTLCYYAWQFTKDVDLARDIVQDVFYVYHKKKWEISSEEYAIKSYLYSSIKFACLKVLRRSDISARYWKETGFQEEYDNEIEYNIIKAEVIADVISIIETLPTACQAIFRKGYLEGLSNLEIAKELNISIATVKTQKQRGLKIIRTKLKSEHFLLFFI